MGTTSEKLSYLNTTKTKIKESLNLGGANLTNETFREYADEIKDRYLYFMNNGLDVVWDNWDKVTGTGTSLTLNNTEEAPMSLTYKGNTSQNGTPTPSSPVNVDVVSGDNSIVVCGKNLYDYTKQRDAMAGNTTETNITNGKKLTVTTSSTGYNFMCYVIKDLSNFVGSVVRVNTTFTKSGNNKAQYGLGLCEQDGSNRTIKIYSETSDTTINFTVPTLIGTQKYLYLVLYANAGGNANANDYADYTNIIVTIDNENMTYEPYKGASYPISLGYKNLFNPSEVVNANTNNIELINKNGLLTLKAKGTTGAQYIYGFIKNVDSAKKYTFSFKTKKIQLGSAGQPYCRVIIYGSNDDSSYTNTKDLLQQNPVLNQEYTLSGTVTGYKYYRFYIYNNGGTPVTLGETTQYWDLMFNEGETALPYTPYDTTPIELCKIGTYQDKIFKNTPNTTDYDSNLEDNVWYLKKEIGKVVLNGSEEWYINASGTSNWFYFSQNVGATPIQNINSSGLGFSNYYGITNIGTTTTYEGLALIKNNEIVRIRYGTEDTIENFKTWLLTHNVKLYYPILTPTYTEITDTTLINQLEAIKKSVEGQTNISQVNDGLPFELDVTALGVMN